MQLNHLFSTSRPPRGPLCLAILLASIAGSFAQSPAGQQPAVFVPPPQPAPAIPPPPAEPITPFLTGPPDLARFERAKPQCEVWRTGSNVPQKPGRRGDRLEWALVAGNEPVTVVLQFPPALVGKSVFLLQNDGGITIPSGQDSVQIGQNGQVVLLVQLEAAAQRGQLTLQIDSVPTVLRLVRAPVRAVEQRESAIKEGR
jgi:hypothetical protein